MNLVKNFVGDMVRGNPFESEIGQLIERATDSKNDVEDWNLYMQVCDAISTTPDGPREAIRALRRRLELSFSTNSTTAIYTLTLLETCVINCGYRFHVVLGTRDTLNALAAYVTPPFNAGVPIAVQDKLLRLIKGWAIAFEKNVDLHEFVVISKELEAKNIEFPTVDLSKPSLISPEPSTYASLASKGTTELASCTRLNPKRSAHTMQENRLKLSEDLQQMETNINTLALLLDDSQDESLSDELKALIRELAETIRLMQFRLVSTISYWEAVISFVNNDQNVNTLDATLVEMLNTNDSALAVLARYDGLQTPTIDEDIVQPASNVETLASLDAGIAATNSNYTEPPFSEYSECEAAPLIKFETPSKELNE